MIVSVLCDFENYLYAINILALSASFFWFVLDSFYVMLCLFCDFAGDVYVKQHIRDARDVVEFMPESFMLIGARYVISQMINTCLRTARELFLILCR